MTLTPAVRQQKQVGFQKFEASLVSVASSRPARDIVIPCFKLKKKKKRKGKEKGKEEFFFCSRNGEEMLSTTTGDY